MTSSLPNVHRGPCSVLGGPPSLPPSSGPTLTVNNGWSSRFSDEGATGALVAPRGLQPGAPTPMTPGIRWQHVNRSRCNPHFVSSGSGPSTPGSPGARYAAATGHAGGGGGGHGQLPTTPEGLHRFIKGRVRAALNSRQAARRAALAASSASHTAASHYASAPLAASLPCPGLGALSPPGSPARHPASSGPSDAALNGWGHVAHLGGASGCVGGGLRSSANSLTAAAGAGSPFSTAMAAVLPPPATAPSGSLAAGLGATAPAGGGREAGAGVDGRAAGAGWVGGVAAEASMGRMVSYEAFISRSPAHPGDRLRQLGPPPPAAAAASAPFAEHDMQLRPGTCPPPATQSYGSLHGSPSSVAPTAPGPSWGAGPGGSPPGQGPDSGQDSAAPASPGARHRFRAARHQGGLRGTPPCAGESPDGGGAACASPGSPGAARWPPARPSTVPGPVPPMRSSGAGTALGASHMAAASAARQALAAQQRLERLITLDVGEALHALTASTSTTVNAPPTSSATAASAPPAASLHSPRQHAGEGSPAPPGAPPLLLVAPVSHPNGVLTLDGMGHPVLVAPDGARITARPRLHVPMTATEKRERATRPLRPEEIEAELLGLGRSVGGDGSSEGDEDEDGSSGSEDGAWAQRRLHKSPAGTAKGVRGEQGRSPRRGGGDGLGAEASGKVGKWRGTGVGGQGALNRSLDLGARRSGIRGPPSPHGRMSYNGVTGGGGGGRMSLTGGDGGAQEEPAPPRYLVGMYIPKDDPLGLWTGKRMSKLEESLDRRLRAIRHNPMMKGQLVGRAGEALKQRAAANAEVAAVTAAREEEMLARRAALVEEAERRRRGLQPRSTSPKRQPFTKDAKMALERRLLAEMEAERRAREAADAEGGRRRRRREQAMTPHEAAAVIQATWKMYLQRRAYARFLRAVVRVQRWARLRYCVVRTRRRHRAAAMLLLDFLQAIAGTRRSVAALDMREVHSNYLRRRLLEKKSDLRTQTATAVLVREWDAVEQRILAMGPGTRRLRATLTGIAGVAGGGGPGGGAAAAAVVTATVTAAAEARPGGGGGAASAAVASGANAGFGAGATRGGTTGDKDVLAAAGGSGKAAHATRLLGKALEARKRGVMPVTDGGDDINKQLSYIFPTDRVTQADKEPVPSEVKAVVIACYLEHKAAAHVALTGRVWLRRARWWQLFKQQQQLAMARSVVATGTTWQADEIARAATEERVGPLPSVPRMRVTATLLELRALMQAGVQEAALFTAHMLRGGLHELERKLHAEVKLRQSFGHLLRSEQSSGEAGGGGPPGRVSFSGLPVSRTSSNGTAGGGSGGGGAGAAAGGTPRGRALAGVGAASGRRSLLGLAGELSSDRIGTAGGGAGAAGRQTQSLTSIGTTGGAGMGAGAPPPSRGSMSGIGAVGGRSRRQLAGPSRLQLAAGAAAAAAAASPLGGGGGVTAADYADALSDVESDAGGGSVAAGMVGGGTTGVVGMGPAAGASSRAARFLAAAPSVKANVSQQRERWWREAVVRVDACLRKRYRMNQVDLIRCLQDPGAPHYDLYALGMVDIAGQPVERYDALLEAMGGVGVQGQGEG